MWEASLPQLEGVLSFLWPSLAARGTIFTDTFLFVRFNQRLENNRYPYPSASRTQIHPGETRGRGKPTQTPVDAPCGSFHACYFVEEEAEHRGKTAGLNRNVFVECHRSLAVFFYEAAWFNGAAVSPSPRLWTNDRRINLILYRRLCGYGMVHAAGPSFQPLKNTGIMDSHPL